MTQAEMARTVAPYSSTITAATARILSEHNFDRADRAAEQGKGENVVGYYWQRGAYFAAVADEA